MHCYVGGSTNFKAKDLCQILIDMEDEEFAMNVSTSHNDARQHVGSHSIEPAVKPPAFATGSEPGKEGEEPLMDEEEVGVGDAVRCVYCGGWLRNWVHEDSPWEEHARRYPSCPHVQLVKGQVDVDRLKRGEKPELDGPIDQTVAFKASPEELLNTDAAKACLQNGYEKEKVLQAIDRYVNETGGSTNFKGKELCQILIDMEDEEFAMDVPSSHNAAMEDREARNIEPAVYPHAVTTGSEPDMEGKEAVTQEEGPLMEEESIVASLACGLLGMFYTRLTKRRSCH